MAPGKYSLADTVIKGQIHDLEIGEVVVNSTLCEAIFQLSRIIAEYNSSLPAPRQHSSVLTRLASLREKPPITPFKEIKGSGRLTWHTARLGDQILAAAYKIEGRKITRRDLLRHLASDIRTVSAVAGLLETAMQECDHRTVSTNLRATIRHRRQCLARVRDQIAKADENRT
jgi:hypothetical protein